MHGLFSEVHFIIRNYHWQAKGRNRSDLTPAASLLSGLLKPYLRARELAARAVALAAAAGGGGATFSTSSKAPLSYN